MSERGTTTLADDQIQAIECYSSSTERSVPKSVYCTIHTPPYVSIGCPLSLARAKTDRECSASRLRTCFTCGVGGVARHATASADDGGSRPPCRRPKRSSREHGRLPRRNDEKDEQKR